MFQETLRTISAVIQTVIKTVHGAIRQTHGQSLSIAIFHLVLPFPKTVGQVTDTTVRFQPQLLIARVNGGIKIGHMRFMINSVQRKQTIIIAATQMMIQEGRGALRHPG